MDELLYMVLSVMSTFIYYYTVITHSLCVYVFGLNATRVAGNQGESPVGERGT